MLLEILSEWILLVGSHLRFCGFLIFLFLLPGFCSKDIKYKIEDLNLYYY